MAQKHTPEIVLPTAEHHHTIIFLHGRGSTAAEFHPELFESQASDGRYLPDIFPHAKWLFPTSGMMLNRFGDVESQWFDMWTTENPHERFEEQKTALNEAVARIKAQIAEEAALVGGAQNVVLAGISQGCAVAVAAMLCQGERIGGFVGLSSWFPKVVAGVMPGVEVVKTPVFVGHCQDDSVIEIKYGEGLRDHLEGLGMEVQWQSYPDGGHWVNEPEGIDDMVKFIHEALKNLT
ncbi:uncharacterized protein LTR77_006122 [Saxophila tyrrhenica]|uniref:Phospholipase/carboxylesterase/thioesterase domain-containing protein n=1 Tax=Saxophila tyrrhenica TaxID=1690608 RepID=A0AAV9P7V1_9PEZI|nr:hypothetical protein LTR77_006122 [Saxophila tyrrhenica]